MNTKTIIAIVVGSVVSFLLGWAVFGILLMDYYEANMVQYEGMNYEEPILWAIYLSGLIGCTMMGWLFGKMNINNFVGGFQTAAILYFFISLSYSLMFYSMMNWYANTTVIIVDVAANTLFGGVLGGIIAMLMGRGGEKQAA